MLLLGERKFYGGYGLVLSDFEGETYQTCHAIRSGTKYIKKQSTQSYNLVIIGAGISGLTAAYAIKNKLKVRIIEKEPTAGGSSKRGLWNGIYYSLGAADTGPTYTVEIEGKKKNFLQDLYKDLDIHWAKVAAPNFAFKYKNNLYVDPLHSASSENNDLGEIQRSFQEAEKRVETIFKEYGKPIIPLETLSKKTLSLDKKDLADFFQDIGHPFRVYLETFSKATFGAPASEVSALKGLYYLSREMGDRFTCPGGNACLAEKLADKVKDKIQLSSTVVSIEKKDKLYQLTYVTLDGDVQTIECNAVVWASEKHYAPYVIKGLPAEQENAFRRIRYSSFIVANVLVNRSFYNQAFATYFDDAPFADIVIADWIAKKGNPKIDEPTVYTLYCPIGSKDRFTLLTQPAEKWKNMILSSRTKFWTNTR